MTRKTFLLTVCLLAIGGTLLMGRQPPADAQPAPTPTPAPLNFPTPAPLVTRIDVEQPTQPPTFTPTEVGPPVLRALEGSGDINLRAEPDPSAEIVGQLRQGEEFVVTGRYFLWYRLRYEDARGGEAYVFGQLVQIVGDEAEIPDLTQITEPTVDPAVFAPTETFEALQQTPGWEETATFSVREIDGPGDPSAGAASAPGAETTGEPRPVLPTFTYPPDVIAQAPTDSPGGFVETTEPERTTPETSGGVAPIVPIGVLAGLGIIGLLLGLLRR